MKRARAKRSKAKCSDSSEPLPKVQRPVPQDTSEDEGTSLLDAPVVERKVCYVDRLPDHLVVQIFQRLSSDDIALLLPQVCKRWSRLASHALRMSKSLRARDYLARKAKFNSI